MNVSERITKNHLARKAVVYVRQSTESQVIQNTGSQQCQREQSDYAVRYGWDPSQVEVIADLAQSASLRGNRTGYESLLKQIDEERVGAIFYYDISRMNRNTLDFEILLMKCKDHDVLFFENGRLVDPQDLNDALMVTVRAAFAQHDNLLRAKKSQDGKKAKIKAGQAVSSPPVGYVVGKKGYWEKHPDERVRETLDFIFERALHERSIYALSRVLLEKGIQVPVRKSRKPEDLGIDWKTPTYKHVISLFQNPNYTQDYYFRQQVGDRRRGYYEKGHMKGRPKIRKANPDEQLVIRDHHEAYIDRVAFGELKKKHEENKIGRFQPLREGKNLLQGIVFCGLSGKRMGSEYSSRDPRIRYYVCREFEPRCEMYAHLFNAADIDAEVEELLLKVVQKPTVEAVIEHYEKERRGEFLMVNEYDLQVRRAEKEAERAKQAYEAVDPANHRVKKKMEEEWDRHLQALEELKAKAVDRPEPRPPLTKEQKERLDYLCEHFPQTFRHSSIDIVTKKRLIRCFIRKAVITLKDDLITVELHWHTKDESVSRLTISTMKYINRYIREQRERGLDEQGILAAMEQDGVRIRGRVFTKKVISQYLKKLGYKNCNAEKRKLIHEAVSEYHRQGFSAREIAKRLNEAGIKPIRAARFAECTVKNVLAKLRLRTTEKHKAKTKDWDLIQRLLDEGLTLREIADRLNAEGRTTQTGLPYDCQRLRGIIQRKGVRLSKAHPGLPPQAKKEAIAMHARGLSFDEAHRLLVETSLIDSGPKSKRQLKIFYRSITHKGVKAEDVPKDFQEMVYDRLAKGISLKEIAAELNRNHAKPIRSDRYTAGLVYRYCKALGISWKRRGYELDSELMELIYSLHAAGKSCQEIAEQVNAAGFAKYGGAPFDFKVVWAVLRRNGKEPVRKDKAAHIVEKVKALSAEGYHPRTIARKLNAMGLKTVQGKRFKTANVIPYLRKVKADKAKEEGSVAQEVEEAA